MSEGLKTLNQYKELIFGLEYNTHVPVVDEDPNFIAEPALTDWYISEFTELGMTF